MIQADTGMVQESWMKHSISFGQWVKQRRKALNLTQAELGRLVSCSAVMINKIEGNQRRPSVHVAQSLAHYLKIAPKEHATFISVARPELSPEQIEEIATPQVETPRPANRQITNLPIPSTPLIGRADEVAGVCALILDPDIRLVTLTGAGGMGKTRLGLQVAVELFEQFEDGCWFISLAALEEAGLIIPTIARALGIKESQNRALDEALLNYLEDKDMLLVLDNFEQVISGARKVAEILASVAGLKILVTSRTVLHLSSEYEFVVPPLKFVDLCNSPSSAELAESPVVSLFVQRARTVNVDFKLTSENAMIVAKICARLDGLPLAIELAASRIKFLTPLMLLSRLEGSAPEDSPLNLLSGGGKDMPARQQTMRRAIDWSYNLLSESEQDLFRHLAVFVGGCTLEAAAIVCGDAASETVLLPTPPRALYAMSDRLASLVDQSMLRQIHTADGEPRYGMLESLREYALERLAERNREWTALKRRHARYFMALTEAAEPKFAGSEQEIWLDRLDAEHDNLLAALAWSCASGNEAELGLKLAGAGWQFWLIRGYANEGRLWLSRVLERAKLAPKLARARALNGAGFLNWAWSDFQQAKSLLTESLALFRELGNRHGTAWVLNHLGHVALTQGEPQLAANLVQESLALFRELGADWNIAWDLLNLGDILRAQGNEIGSIPHYEESLELFRKLGDHRGTAWTLDHLGRLAHGHQDYKQAMTLLLESLSLFRKLGDKCSAAWVLNHLSGVALAQNDFQQARFFVEESLALFGEISAQPNGGGATLDLGWATMDLGDTARELGDEAQAEMLFTRSLKIFREVDDQRGAGMALEHLERLRHLEHAG